MKWLESAANLPQARRQQSENVMPGNAYLDFDLRFRKERTGYRVEIIQSPGGHAEHRFKLPFSEMELENYMLKIGRRHSGVRSATSPETKAARDFGTKLFDTVFQDDVQACFSRSLEEAKRRNSGLRLRLHLEQTPELADLPWEYLSLAAAAISRAVRRDARCALPRFAAGTATSCRRSAAARLGDDFESV
jgi:hypothetical protein